MDAATDPPATNPQTGAGPQPPGGAAAPSSAGRPSRGGAAASPGSDPAREPLSKFQRLYLTFSAIGLGISALGFTAVIVSIRTAREQMANSAAQTRLQVRDRTLGNMLALDRVFLDHPELRPYFYDGKDLDKSDPRFAQVEAVAEMHLDVFDYALNYRLQFPNEYHFPEGHESFIREMLAQSPVMRRHLEKKAAWYSPELRALLN
jgi:hypothetical protein